MAERSRECQGGGSDSSEEAKRLLSTTTTVFDNIRGQHSWTSLHHLHRAILISTTSTVLILHTHHMQHTPSSSQLTPLNLPHYHHPSPHNPSVSSDSNNNNNNNKKHGNPTKSLPPTTPSSPLRLHLSNSPRPPLQPQVPSTPHQNSRDRIPPINQTTSPVPFFYPGSPCQTP